MAEYLPIRAFNRSANVRIESQKVGPTVTTFIDISKAVTRKELAYHSSIGQVYVVGSISASNSEFAFDGVEASADGTDLKIATSDGTIRNRGTGAKVVVQPASTTLGTASGSNPRIDLIEVSKTTGEVKKVAGTAAASPVAPAADEGFLVVAEVLVGTSVTSVDNTKVTDKRTL